MTDIERTVEYQPRNAHIESIQATKIKHTPLNGSSFDKNSDFIEFRIQPDNSWVDSPKTKLHVTFTPKDITATAGTAADFGIYSSPSVNSCFSRLECRIGGNLIENVLDYNRIFTQYNKIYSSSIQNQTNGSIEDLYSPSSIIGTESSAVGVKLNSTDANPPTGLVSRTCSIPLSLSNLFGPSARKAFPLALCKQVLTIRLYITSSVEEVIYSHGGSAAYDTAYGSANFSLSNVSLEMTHIRYPQMSLDRIREGMPREIVWDGVQTISSTSNIGYSSQERVILPNTSYSDVRNVVINQWYPTYAGNQVTQGCSPLNGLYQSQLFLDGHPVSRNRPVGSVFSNLPTNSQSEIASSVISLNRPFRLYDDVNTQITISRSSATGATTQNFNLNNGGGGAAAEPFSIPAVSKPLVSVFAPANEKPVSPYFGLVGFDLTNNGDPSRDNVGHDCRGRQMVYQARQTNTIPNTEPNCVIQAILCVGVKYMLDRDAGIIRTIY
jgi:hypothetical protein